ncbi:9585_t:CDS:2 [Dentiscutata erythropus]|uniref:9585_t:CDS:1 n=1 Tax=Dentiscutata erythropus TaxID=1348616 RepID=A0A9N9C619_9GLOM|nr:9585_t:CDS:2 [Dentiscutata erythropus]
MNQKYLIGLHVFFFLILAEKTYGCYPVGDALGEDLCGAKILDANLKVRRDGINVAPHALGHLTMHDDTGNSGKFLRNSKFVNGYICTSDDPSQQKNPFTYSVQFDLRHLQVELGLMFGFQCIGIVLFVQSNLYIVGLSIYTIEVM